MFYVNNEQVKGIFLNGRNFNYLAFGFGKIIPEDRNVYQLNLNLAGKYLNKYRIEWGTVKDGYENALVSPRFDKPDSNGIFHTPFTYYYNGNIISTKEVPVLITNGNYALSNALVYNDMNINGAINYFAENTDFQGHNVNVFKEAESLQVYQALLNYEVLDNCSNFDLNINTRFGKASSPTLYNCNNFSGNFRYVGNQDREYPGFRGFLEDCKDGVFNINCTNMHGGGSAANVTNYYNFSGISSCNNIKLNIIGSSWQVWPHDHSFTSNCNINTYNVISGFSYMNYCNFNVVLPKDSKPEMTSGFAFLSDAENCNYNLNATDVNLYNYRSGTGLVPYFDYLNNCNLNLLVNNTASFDHSFGGNLNNCNIVFDNIKADLSTYSGWSHLNNCNISGNVEATDYSQPFIKSCYNTNVDLNAAKSSRIMLLFDCINIKGNINWLGSDTQIKYISGINIQRLNNGNVTFNYVSSGYFRVNNTTFRCYNTNDTEIQSDSSNVNILGADNCYNLKLSGLTFQTPDSDSLFENIYNSDLKFGIVYPYYRLWRVENCKIDGFPRGFAYVNNCVFRPFNIKQVGLRNSEVGTWSNVWPHRTLAGIRSTNIIENCWIRASGWDSDGSITFNNINNMQTSFGNYYDGTVTANLPIYDMNIKLNVDCNTLNLGIRENQAFPGMPSGMPAHGFQNATISANNIYAEFSGISINACVQLNRDTKIYCENYCDVPFYYGAIAESDSLQPVVLINNYRYGVNTVGKFYGGLSRFGGLTYLGSSTPANLTLGNCAFVFINNALLGRTKVTQNSVLFLGSNVRFENTLNVNVSSGGLIVGRGNWGSHASEIWSRIGRGHLAWNIWDSGPWGSSKLIDFCIWV